MRCCAVSTKIRYIEGWSEFLVVAFFFIVFDDTLTATVCGECYESTQNNSRSRSLSLSHSVGRIMISADGLVLQVVWRDARLWKQSTFSYRDRVGVKSGTDMKHYRAQKALWFC